MTPRERGEHAKRLLNDPVLLESMDAIRLALVAKIEASAMGDRDTHHEAALSLQLLKQVRAQLLVFVGDAQMDEHRAKQDAFVNSMKQSLKPR